MGLSEPHFLNFTLNLARSWSKQNSHAGKTMKILILKSTLFQTVISKSWSLSPLSGECPRMIYEFKLTEFKIKEGCSFPLCQSADSCLNNTMGSFILIAFRFYFQFLFVLHEGLRNEM